MSTATTTSSLRRARAEDAKYVCRSMLGQLGLRRLEANRGQRKTYISICDDEHNWGVQGRIVWAHRQVDRQPVPAVDAAGELEMFVQAATSRSVRLHQRA